MSNILAKNHGHLLWAIIVTGLVGTALMITSCKPQERDLPFETIEQKEWAGTGQSYEAREPGLMIISRLQDITSLDKLVTDGAMTKLKELDYDNCFVLVVFQGWKPTTGYRVQIDRTTRTGKMINIYTQFLEPKPEEAKADAITSPYHLVQVQKTGEWGQEISFQVIVNETIVSSLAYFIP